MAKDKYHDLVKELLENEGWTIIKEQFSVKIGKRRAEIDLAAERLIQATKGVEQIAVEVKSFLTKSHFHEFHRALGQFKNYRRIMRLVGLELELFVAMPEDVYHELLEDEFGQVTIEEENLKIIVYSIEDKKIVQWIR